MFDLIPFGRNERNLFQYLDNVEKSLFDGLDTRVSRFRTDILDKGDRYLLEAELAICPPRTPLRVLLTQL